VEMANLKEAVSTQHSAFSRRKAKPAINKRSREKSRSRRKS
jgi:hypothetical protein